MYALHPGSLPPRSAKAKERVDVTAEDLIALYAIDPTECIVWDKADGYDWFDFIHLYPSYYERYTLKPDGTPEKDVPCDFVFKSSAVKGTSKSSKR
jgi:hypothetical protein